MKTIKKYYIIWGREGGADGRQGGADGREGGVEVAREGPRFRI